MSTFDAYTPFEFDWRFSLRRIFVLAIVVGGYIAIYRPGPNTPIEGNPLGWPFHVPAADLFICGPIALTLSLAVVAFILFPRMLTGIIAGISILLWIGIGYLLATWAAV